MNNSTGFREKIRNFAYLHFWSFLGWHKQKERFKLLGLERHCTRGGGGGTPYNGLYEEAPPERGTFFRLRVYKRVGISQVEGYKRVGKSVV